MLPSTYKQYSYYVLGYYAEPTPVNQKYIATLSLQRISNINFPSHTFLKWNAGERATRCSKGVNPQGVPYDSCEYVEKAMDHYKKLIKNK